MRKVFGRLNLSIEKPNLSVELVKLTIQQRKSFAHCSNIALPKQDFILGRLAAVRASSAASIGAHAYTAGSDIAPIRAAWLARAAAPPLSDRRPDRSAMPSTCRDSARCQCIWRAR